MLGPFNVNMLVCPTEPNKHTGSVVHYTRQICTTFGAIKHNNNDAVKGKHFSFSVAIDDKLSVKIFN